VRPRGKPRDVVDSTDLHIIELMRVDARSSFQRIGAQVGLTAPAVKRRLDRLEQAGVIRSYAAVIDPIALGWSMEAFVELYCDGRMSSAAVRAAVEAFTEVGSAYTVAGEASAILHVHARDAVDLEDVLERIRERDGVIRTQTQMVMSRLFERPTRPLPIGDGVA
jgi:DNA-binding Lrp family transcriptional regulator